RSEPGPCHRAEQRGCVGSLGRAERGGELVQDQPEQGAGHGEDGDRGLVRRELSHRVVVRRAVTTCGVAPFPSPQVTVKLRFAISPLVDPLALMCCRPRVAFGGTMISVVNAPVGSATTFSRRIVPWVESKKVSRMRSPAAKPQARTCTTVPGG